MSEQIIIQSKHISKDFGAFRAVDKVDFSVNEGECEGIIGPNGAGKSTFFNLLTGLHKPTEGNILYNGEDITNESSDKRTVKGLVRTFQLVSVFDTLTVLQNLILSIVRFQEDYTNKFLFTLGNSEADHIRNTCIQSLKHVGLENRKDELASNLSYGQKRKLEIAMALALKPKVLLLDEPLAGLSDYEIKEVISLIYEVKEKFTIVLIEHKISYIQDLVSRLSVMHEGRMVAHGNPKDVINDREVRRIYWGVST